jgi:hypothetical protein
MSSELCEMFRLIYGAIMPQTSNTEKLNSASYLPLFNHLTRLKSNMRADLKSAYPQPPWKSVEYSLCRFHFSPQGHKDKMTVNSPQLPEGHHKLYIYNYFYLYLELHPYIYLYNYLYLIYFFTLYIH